MKISSKNIKKEKISGSYKRLIGNEKIAELITKIQSCVISQGKELENSIFDFFKLKYPNCILDNLKNLLDGLLNNKNNIYLFSKPLFKSLQNSIKSSKKEADFIFVFVNNKSISIIELKAGFEFDTKKAESEKQSLLYIKDLLEKQIQDYKINYYLCSFYADNINKLYLGLKKKINKENLLIGEMFFDHINLKYKEFLELWEKKLIQDQKDNQDYIYKIVNEELKN